MMIKVNAIGDTCPIPIVKAKHAIGELHGPGEVEILVDNEIAVQNLTKMANQKGYGVRAEKLEGQCYKVTLTIGEVAETAGTEETAENEPENACGVNRKGKKNTVVAISSSRMGEGDDELGSVLMKGFIYALTRQEELPAAILFYNGGAVLTCEEPEVGKDSALIEDLKLLEAQGVEILTCGTCLNHYGLTDRLQVGSVTNMYVIAEKLTQADLVVKP